MMNRFKFDISDAQFKELMILLDPQHTNVISYHHFLILFEQRETKVPRSSICMKTSFFTDPHRFLGLSGYSNLS